MLWTGDFVRPKLKYRCLKREDAEEDVLAEVKARPGKAGIVYCIRRSDVDDIAKRLKKEKIKAVAYHAGMDDEDRTRAQDRFASGEVDVVVATVAFGMGIDRSDIRYVLHAAMPKSLEHYQQETGRAGRDGKPADCILFHSGQDFQMWNSIITKNESGDLDTKLKMLSEMYNFATSARCRHRRLVEYFGQSLIFVSSVSLARVSVVSRCLGPSASAVMKGRLMLVDWVVESSILAFSAAS